MQVLDGGPMSMDDLKSHYNDLLAREKKGEAYIDDPVRTPGEVEKWMPEFNKILAELNNTLGRIGSFTAEEITHGFDLGKGKNKRSPNQDEMSSLFSRIAN